MIASLTGTVGRVRLDRLVLVVGGVGMLVHTTPAAAASLRQGSEATLATSLVVREDALTLYGFLTESERDMFETAQTVNGVGPRLALAMLSVFAPDDFAAAISAGDVSALRKIPGVGPKSAERIALELRDKVSAKPGSGGSGEGGLRPGPSVVRDQITEALVGLGWNAKQAASAVDHVLADSGADEDVPGLLRRALRELSR